MHVLVIGGTGFLSSAIVEELVKAQHKVTIFTRGRRDRKLPEGVNQITGDRKDKEKFRQLLEGHQFDAVVDCICYVEEDANQDIEVFSGKVGHLIFISTDFTYGGEPRHLPMNEETPQNALNDYGRNKVACEKLFLQAWHEKGFPVTILRPPHVVGAGGHLGSGSYPGRDPMLLDRLRKGKPVILLDDGQLLIQPVYHRDVGRACVAVLGGEAQAKEAPMIRAAKQQRTFGQAYNVAGPDIVTTRRYYEIIAEILGCELKTLSLPSSIYVQAFPDRAPFALHRVYSTFKLMKDTGYAPATPLKKVMKETIQWLEESGEAKPYQEDGKWEALSQALEKQRQDVLNLLRD